MTPNPHPSGWLTVCLDFFRQHRGACFTVIAALIAGGYFIGRHHHPVYGFTKFIQLSEAIAINALPEIHRVPVYVHDNPWGYDGQFYSQLALRPALRDPGLNAAIDNFPLRARRPLTNWIAWLVSAGDTSRILHVYAWVNVVGWFVFAFLLIRLIPPTGIHQIIAWLGLMFSAGVLTSVGYALTDLPALILIAAAMLALQHRHPKTTAGLLAAATLTRETSVLAGSILLPGCTWPQRFIRGLILVVPFALWLGYVRLIAGAETQSLGNFDWPFLGLGQKIRESIGLLLAHPNDLLHGAAFLTTLGVVVQAGWLLLNPKIKNPWWQLGASYIVLLAFLGWPTFAGYPGAVSRILLPLHLAFNLLVPATRLGTVILLLGNLSVVSGLTMLRYADRDPSEIVAASQADGDYLAWITDEWYGVETNGTRTWAWGSGHASLNFRYFPASPASPTPPKVQFLLIGAQGRHVTVSQGDRVLWSGFASQEGVRVEPTDILVDEFGRFTLTFDNADPAWLEDGTATGRHLVFAVYDLELGLP